MAYSRLVHYIALQWLILTPIPLFENTIQSIKSFEERIFKTTQRRGTGMGRHLFGSLPSLFCNSNSSGGRSSAAMCLLAKCVMLSQLLLLSAEDARALLCVPCDPSGCAEPKACGSTVLGACGCCAGCAKQRHESCGGVRGLNGTCDRGLQCVIGTSLDGGSVDVGVCEGVYPDRL